MSRAMLAGLAAVIIAAVSGTAGLAARSAPRPLPAGTGALAVLHEHVQYEVQLIDAVLPRLSSTDGRDVAGVRAVSAALDVELTARLRDLGYSPARAHAVWQQVIGNGAAPPSRVLAYVCSIHAAQSEQVELATTPAGSLAAGLGDIERTLFIEGRQLASHLDGSLAAVADHDQREALHLLAPVLIPTDRAYAATA